MFYELKLRVQWIFLVVVGGGVVCCDQWTSHRLSVDLTLNSKE